MEVRDSNEEKAPADKESKGKNPATATTNQFLQIHSKFI